MRFFVALACLSWVSVAWADTHVFDSASGSDLAQCESTRTFANGWPPPFQDCYDNSLFYTAKDKLNGSPEYYVEMALIRWDTSLLVGATVNSASVDICVDNGTIFNDDTRSFDCEWYPNWVTPSVADYTTGSVSTALSVPLSTLSDVTSPCTVNTLTLTNAPANIQTGGFTALRCTISGSTPGGFNEFQYNGGNDLTTAPKLTVDFTSFTPTPGGGPTLTRTATPSHTPTPSHTSTPTACLPTVHAPLVETNVSLPNGVITVPAPGIPTGRSAILSFAYYFLSSNTGYNNTNTFGPVTDSAGNTWACDGSGAWAWTIQPRTGCPVDQIGLHISQSIAGGMCTIGLCHAPLPPGATISFPGQLGVTTTAAFSLVDIENINISAGSYRNTVNSTPFDCQCYPPDGRGPTIGGLYSTVNEGAINCCPGPFPPQTHCGQGEYYGEMSDGLNGIGGFSVPAGYLIWSSIGSETAFTPTAGTTLFESLSAPSASLTTLYQTQASTGTFSQGGNSAPQLWAQGGGAFAPQCEAAFVAAACASTPTFTPTGPTPTMTETPPAPTQTQIAQATETAGPPATQTRIAQNTQTQAAKTATPTVTPSVTGTLPTVTPTRTPNPQFGCCICPEPMCSSAVTANDCVLAGCSFGGVGTVCTLVP